jgi:hypothetical protein
VFVVAVFAGCSSEEERVHLPETPVLSGQGSVALVTEAYVRLFDRPDFAGAVIGHGRRGDVLAVAARTADAEWVQVDGGDARFGWLPARYLRLFSSREQALNARLLVD